MRSIMKKGTILGTIVGAALLTAAPFSLQWSRKTVALSLDSADARVGRPLTTMSVAGVHRRAHRHAAYGTAAAYGSYGSYYNTVTPGYVPRMVPFFMIDLMHRPHAQKRTSLTQYREVISGHLRICLSKIDQWKIEHFKHSMPVLGEGGYAALTDTIEPAHWD